MGLFNRKKVQVGQYSTPHSNTEPERESVSAPIDASLPDEEWLMRSESRYEEMVENFYGSCDTIANGGSDRYNSQDFGVALFFFQKSIDVLHTNYLFLNMKERQPSPGDAWIVDGYTNSLGVSLSLHPNAPVANSVREVTHRLRTIASACKRVGAPFVLYQTALDQIAFLAPSVNVDDILW